MTPRSIASSLRPLAWLSVAWLVGCAAVGPDYVPEVAPLAPTFTRPGLIDAEAPAAGADADADWWQGFHDPQLAALVASAQARNTDLAQALARVEQARARAEGAAAARRPVLDATGSAGRVRQSRESPIGRITTALGVPRDYDDYSLGVQASWELDLFGGLARGRESAGAELAAARAGAAAVGVRVAAETADAYLVLRGAERRLALAAELVRDEEVRLDLLERRVHYGLSTRRESARARAGVEEARAGLAPLQALAEAQRNRLEVLTGTPPGAGAGAGSGSGIDAEAPVAAPPPAMAGAEPPDPIPEAPLPAGSTEPGALLRRRPDVVLAERRLAASTARVGVAVAEYYPRVSLSGLFGLAGTSLGFGLGGDGRFLSGDAVQASGGVGLRWRLFDFGRIDAEVAGAQGARAEALAAWRGAVLLAAEDVETALARLDAARQQRQAVARQVAALADARAEAQAAFARGVVARFEVLDARREWLLAQDRLATARVDEARAAVAGYRALGGGWRDPSQDQDQDPARARLAAATPGRR